jgi:hypothetical protein
MFDVILGTVADLLFVNPHSTMAIYASDAPRTAALKRRSLYVGPLQNLLPFPNERPLVLAFFHQIAWHWHLLRTFLSTSLFDPLQDLSEPHETGNF